MKLALIVILMASGAVHSTAAQTPSGWRAHDLHRPRPTIVAPGHAAESVRPPSDAVVLFDGSGVAAWRNGNGEGAGWVVRNGAMEAAPGAGYVYSRQEFGDVQLHVEWAAPSPPKDTGQGRGNSGVFLMGDYELQVLDSYHNDTYPDGQAGAAYGQYPPMVNASLPPGAWQSYDIIFHRPRFDSIGVLVAPARMTAFQNGVLIQDNVAFWGPTNWLQANPYVVGPSRGPIALQDHGNPVRYRNIWVRELPEVPLPVLAPPPVGAKVPAGVLDRILGTYANGGMVLVISKTSSGLRVNLPEGRWQRLIPLSPTEFAFSSTAATLTSTVAPGGTPTKLTFRMGDTAFDLTPVLDPSTGR
ncbi:MAG: DUF1080 domain-containing protein [Gemmatimonadales bacterium]|jgi:hypothetical protein|nr:MAG: DUF1080 domain-containing protein [Gemmatimonadales bacterium]